MTQSPHPIGSIRLGITVNEPQIELRAGILLWRIDTIIKAWIKW